MEENWHEEFDMEGGQIGKETEFVFEDDELDSGQTNNAGGQNKHKLHVSNKGKCMFLAQKGLGGRLGRPGPWVPSPRNLQKDKNSRNRFVFLAFYRDR